MQLLGMLPSGLELREPAAAAARSLPGCRGTMPGGGGASSSVSAAVAAARTASAQAAKQAEESAALRMICGSLAELAFSAESATSGRSASELLSRSLQAFELGLSPSPIGRKSARGPPGFGDLAPYASSTSMDTGPRLAAFDDSVVAPVAPMLTGTQATSSPLVIAPSLAGPGQRRVAHHTACAATPSLSSRAIPEKSSRQPSRRRPSEKTSAQVTTNGVERRAISCDELARRHATPECASIERRACSSRPSKRTARKRSEWPESASAYERLDCMEAELLGPRGGGTGAAGRPDSSAHVAYSHHARDSSGFTLRALPDAPLHGQPLPGTASAPSMGQEAAGRRRSRRRSQRSSVSSQSTRRSLRIDAIQEVALADKNLVDARPGESQEELRKQVALRDMEIDKLHKQLAIVQGENEHRSEKEKHAHRRKSLEKDLHEARKQLTCVKEEAESTARREMEAERAEREVLSEKVAALQHERGEALQLLRAILRTSEAVSFGRANEPGEAASAEDAATVKLEEEDGLIPQIIQAQGFVKSELDRRTSGHAAAVEERDRLRSSIEAIQRQYADVEIERDQILSGQSKKTAAIDEEMRYAQERLTANNEESEHAAFGKVCAAIIFEKDQALQQEQAKESDLPVLNSYGAVQRRQREQEIAQLQRERDQLEVSEATSRRSFEEGAQRWKREQVALTHERDAATQASLDAQSKLEDLQKSFTSLKADHEQALSNETHLKIKIRQQEEKEQRIRADFAEERQELQASMKVSEQRLQDDLAKTRHANEGLQVREQRLRDDIDSDRNAREDLERHLRKAKQDAESKLQEMQASCSERSSRIEQLQGELVTCRKEGHEKVMALQSALESAKRDTKVLKLQNDHVQHELAEAARERDQLRDDGGDLNRKKIELSRALDNEREVASGCVAPEQQHMDKLDTGSTMLSNSNDLPELYVDDDTSQDAELSPELEEEEEEGEEEEEEEDEKEIRHCDSTTPSVRWIVDTPTTLETAPSPWDCSPSPKDRNQEHWRSQRRRSSDPFLSEAAELVDQGVSIEGLLDNTDLESH